MSKEHVIEPSDNDIFIAGAVADSVRRIITSFGLPIPKDSGYYFEDFGLPFEAEIQLVCEVMSATTAVFLLASLSPEELRGFDPASNAGFARFADIVGRFKRISKLVKQMVVSNQGVCKFRNAKRAVSFLIENRPLAVPKRGYEFTLASNEMIRQMLRHALFGEDEERNPAAEEAQIVKILSAVLQKEIPALVANNVSPMTHMPISSDQVEGDLSSFLKEGDLWFITFQGKRVPFEDVKGMQYIAYLLQYSGEIAALPLYRAINGLPPLDVDEDKDRSIDVLEDGFQVIESDPGIPVIDLKDLPEYEEILEKERVRLGHELAQAERANRQDRVVELQRQIDVLKWANSSALGKKGKIRRVMDDNERARKSISRNINNALLKIKEGHFAAYSHLNFAIRKGRYFSYCPLTPMTWMVTPL